MISELTEIYKQLRTDTRLLMLCKDYRARFPILKRKQFFGLFFMIPNLGFSVFLMSAKD